MALNWGMKVSLKTKDVRSSNPEDFAFHSAYASVKVVKEPTDKTYGQVTVAAGSTQTVTIPHNLGFVPLCMVFTELNPGSGRWYNGTALVGPDDFTQVCFLNSIGGGTYADSTNLYLVFRNDGGVSKTIKYYYFILGDDGA